jgi:hypothetical protein
MTGEAELVERIRRLIAAGELPATPPGPPEPLPSSDRTALDIDRPPAEACLICLRQHPEYGYPNAPRPIRVHRRCAELWIEQASRSRSRRRP